MSSLKLLVVIIALVSLLVGLGADPSKAHEISQADLDELYLDNHLILQSNSEPRGGLLSSLMSPISAGVRHIKRLVSGIDQESVRNQYERLRLRAFQVFMRMYNKTYSAEELPQRLSLFANRMDMIEASRKSYERGEESYVLRPNEFLDWNDNELKKLSKTEVPGKGEDEDDFENSVPTLANFTIADDQGDLQVGSNNLGDQNSIPRQFSWREGNCLSRVIDQKTCGSCYAVATMGALESTACIRYGTKAVLSYQQIVDCANQRAGYRNHGCNGGWPSAVLRYVQDHRHVAQDSCYPYENRASRCRLAQKRGQCTVDVTRLSPNGGQNGQSNRGKPHFKVLHNERDIQYHVAKTGPVVSVIHTTNKLVYYGRGVMEDSRCSGRARDVDHAIIIVGYGQENGKDYWLIKNSWGTNWGDGGYAKVRRGVFMCSIGRYGWVTFP